MDNIGNAMELAMAALKAENGEDAELDNGDSFVAVFNNGSIIIDFDDNKLNVNVIFGGAFMIDADI